MFTLKPISRDSVDGALAKAERYRLLNEPHEAESICRDILEVDPANRQARISLILALTDQIPTRPARFRAPWRRFPIWRRHTIAPTIPGSRGSGARRRLMTPVDRDAAAMFTIGSSKRCSSSKKRSACGPRATTTPFCAGMPVSVFSSATKT